ncbi:MAG: PD-(D/E)XK nuclease family protein [Phycisphaerales bacterium]|nr:PD-(D/E)XK nuclease family protein [Phycisphaerales bacterium]
MSVRFVIGRAGTGKTHHCLAAIREQLAADPVADSRLVLLVPEQASLQMERALLSDSLRAVARAEVLSFRRLALRILQSSHLAQRQVLSAAARSMVLRTLIAKLGSRLKYYRRVERMPGFLDRLGRTVSELIEEGIAPDALDLNLPGDSAAQRAKFADIREIYNAYLRYLGDTRLDASQYLKLAGEHLPRCRSFDGAHFWVDGFAGFTGLEMTLLRDLAQRAERVEVSLLVDPAGFMAADREGDVDPTDLFARTLRTYLSLRDALIHTGCVIDEPLVLKPPAPRWPQGGNLAQLENGLAFLPADESESADAPRDVAVVEAPDRRTEVGFAVSQVCALVWREVEPLRYRDIALICRDLEPYHDLLSAALRERGIPFFIDRRRSVAHHPLVEFLRNAVSVAATGAGVEPMRLLLKTNLLGLDADAADALENYVLAHGIAGAPLWTESDWRFTRDAGRSKASADRAARRLAEVNRARRRVVAVLGDLLAAQDSTRTGAEWADVLRQLLDRADVDTHVETWSAEAAADGEVERAAEHRQVLDVVHELLDDLADALGDESLNVVDAAQIIEAGLSELTLGLIPPTVDQVLVGSIERSRHPDIKVAIVLGFNDGVFPSLASEDVVLNDEDRTRLADAGVYVRVTRKQRVLDERMLAYVALTRASSKLLLTYAAADDDGRALRPSPYLGDVQRALPSVAARRLGDPAQAGSTAQIWTARDLAAAMTLEFGKRIAAEPVGDERQVRWNDLYMIARGAESTRVILRDALASLTFRNEAQITPASVEAMITAPYTASVSELESFAACPFQRFARWGLKLRLRKEADLQPVDVGTVHHAILEAYLNECLERGERFADVNDADVLPRLERCAESIGVTLGREGELSSARDAYLLARSARDLDPIVQQQRRIAGGGAFRPRAAERRYGFDDEASLPALEIDTPMGRRVRIRGAIDRIDLAEVGDECLGVVVDYKRTRDKRLDLSRVFHGLSLQLLGYLLVLADQGATLAGRPIVPAGAFYVSLLRKYRAVDHPDDAGDDDDEVVGAVPRGLLDASRLAELDSDAPESGWSKLYKVYRKRDGSLGYADAGDAATAADFRALLDHTRQRLGELADRVLDGDVAVSPYRIQGFSPCQWCDMRAVCRFEFGDPGMRHLEALKRSQVFKRLAGEE